MYCVVFVQNVFHIFLPMSIHLCKIAHILQYPRFPKGNISFNIGLFWNLLNNAELDTNDISAASQHSCIVNHPQRDEGVLR